MKDARRSAESILMYWEFMSIMIASDFDDNQIEIERGEEI